jgi:hypothetical protein
VDRAGRIGKPEAFHLVVLSLSRTLASDRWYRTRPFEQ